MFGFLTFIVVLGILFSLHLIGLIFSSFYIKTEKFITVRGYKIHYKSTGSGSKKVLLIHGMFSNMHCWDKFLAYALPDTEFISIDLPQTGESQVKKMTTPAYEIEDVIYDLCQALKFEQVTVVGCSLGGLVAYLSALKYPDYFKKCVIVASPFDSRILILPIYKLSFLSPLLNLFVNPVIIAMVYIRIARSRFSFSHVMTIFSKFRSTQHFTASMDYLRLIPRVENQLRIPTKVENFHFIWGTKDHVVKKANFDNFIGNNDKLDYGEIPDASHHPMESHPEEFSKALGKII